FDGVRNGETYDARLEQPGWDTPRFDAQDWENASIICSPGGTLVAQQQPPTKVMQTITPVSVTEVKPGVFIFDMGQNIAGWGQLTVSGPAGTQVVMKYAEKIGEDGDIDPKNIDKFISTGEFQTDTYILKGDGVEVWEPHFTFHGFRYAQMTGFPGTPTVENLRGRVVYTSFDTIGSFACSNQLLNDLQRCTQWSFIGNFVGYPTDCPHREKNGWTGDAQIAVETGLYNYTPAAAYARWMFDFDDAQRPNGELPGIIPTPGWGYNWGNGPAWDSAFLIIPWNVYQYCGDTRILADHYAGMKRYMTFMESMATDDMLTFGLGDWCPPKGNNYVKTPVLFTSTGYYYANSRMMAAIADLLGKQDDAVYFTKLAEKIKTAFTRTYIDPASGKCLVSEQTAVSCILYQGLDDAANHDVLVAQLAETVKNADYHIDCGILGAKYLLHALSNNGYADLAYRIVAQKSYPSWGHWLEQGATTLWESWEGGSSRNHIMFGDISAWFYAALAGIKPAAPGFKQIVIHPHPVCDLTKAEGEYLSAYGRIRSAWEIVDGRFSLEVAVPANTSATVYVPADDVKKITENGAEAASSAGITFQCMKDGCAVFAVEPGTYHFIAE
ncbi:MAG TPA: family 78 glycoside hydrolase catalytic domain, partial [Armatimonadota bacterium]|nr:family 78 glycoside hydrolase catalytic domain [Armatimonadota bacterium]